MYVHVLSHTIMDSCSMFHVTKTRRVLVLLSVVIGTLIVSTLVLLNKTASLIGHSPLLSQSIVCYTQRIVMVTCTLAIE